MTTEGKEDLYLRSLDGSINVTEQSLLGQALTIDHPLKKAAEEFGQIRELLSIRQGESFGPFFAERVVHHLKVLKNEIDYQLFFFFKKYQLAALGLIVALLAINIILSSTLSLPSILGLEDETLSDIVQIDLFENLTN
jgi:hypothetical protein